MHTHTPQQSFRRCFQRLFHSPWLIDQGRRISPSPQLYGSLTFYIKRTTASLLQGKVKRGANSVRIRDGIRITQIPVRVHVPGVPRRGSVRRTKPRVRGKATRRLDNHLVPIPPRLTYYKSSTGANNLSRIIFLFGFILTFIPCFISAPLPLELVCLKHPP